VLRIASWLGWTKFGQIAFIWFALFSQVSCAEVTEPMRLPLDKTPMTISTPQGEVAIEIEVARSKEERGRGLMFRERLPDGQGMLFVFEEPDVQNFWMKNTPQPLDIIYISTEGTIVSISKGIPFSTDPIPSSGPAQLVLELAEGEAQKAGLAPGQTFSHPIISSLSK
jgi:hypothetical protein